MKPERHQGNCCLKSEMINLLLRVARAKGNFDSLITDALELLQRAKTEPYSCAK